MRTSSRAIHPCPIVPLSRLMIQFYLGSKDAAISRQFITSQRITHMINCATNSVPNIVTVTQCSFLSLYLIENDVASLFDKTNKTIARICHFLDSAMEQDGIVLIHSPKGHNRAMLVAAIYLIHRYAWSADQAIEVVSVCRQSRMKASVEQGLRAQSMNIPCLQQSVSLMHEALTIQNTHFNQTARIKSHIPHADSPARTTFQKFSEISVFEDYYDLSHQKWHLSGQAEQVQTSHESILRSGKGAKSGRSVKIMQTHSPFHKLQNTRTKGISHYIPLSYNVPQIDFTNLPSFLRSDNLVQMMVNSIQANLVQFTNTLPPDLITTCNEEPCIFDSPDPLLNSTTSQPPTPPNPSFTVDLSPTVVHLLRPEALSMPSSPPELPSPTQTSSHSLTPPPPRQRLFSSDSVNRVGPLASPPLPNSSSLPLLNTDSISRPPIRPPLSFRESSLTGSYSGSTNPPSLGLMSLFSKTDRASSKPFPPFSFTEPLRSPPPSTLPHSHSVDSLTVDNTSYRHSNPSQHSTRKTLLSQPRTPAILLLTSPPPRRRQAQRLTQTRFKGRGAGKTQRDSNGTECHSPATAGPPPLAGQAAQRPRPHSMHRKSRAESDLFRTPTKGDSETPFDFPSDPACLNIKLIELCTTD
ncbi:hypothetical protein BLNAU_19814 [Blattamonas nauphoetae]|uniref:Dual specificity phosphatase catalytic domain-containing protein n=1 Tax=Blattamonas nauphoetae TaxID=2049346 RepID=A0ABQ9X0Y7_9EUKA|nr:hypothetical protein BLNAU_19814 [Blattamonas nauphoetae]